MANPSSVDSYSHLVADPSASAASPFILAEDPSSSSPSQFLVMAGPSSSSCAVVAEQQEQDMTEQRDWASLQSDLLSRIVAKVRHGLDYLSFRSVCSGWLSAAPLLRFPPMLMLSFQPETGRIPLFNPSDGKISIFPYMGPRDAAFTGCCGSWLMLVERNGKMSMANPFTGDVIQLPLATDELPGHSNMPFSMSGAYRVGPSSLGNFKMEQVWRSFVEDVALSADPYANGMCTIMLTLACSNRVAFCRVGTDAAWTVLDTGLIGPVRTVRFCSGRFFVVDWNGAVAACEVPAEGAPGNATVTRMESLRMPVGFNDTKILEHNGELYMVASSSFAHLGGIFSMTTLRSHEVFKSDLQGCAPGWSRVRDMGDSTIFVTLPRNSCYIVSNLAGCQRDSIYFSDHDPYEPYYGQAHNIKVLDLETGISSTVCTNYASYGNMKVVSWLKPSLLHPRN